MDKNNYEDYKNNYNQDVDNNIKTNYSSPCNDNEFDIRKDEDCNSYKCISSIICSQAKVSKCEAEAFCIVIKKLCCELQQCHKLSDCLKTIDLISEFFRASACKEKSIAEVITSCKLDCKRNTKDDDCC